MKIIGNIVSTLVVLFLLMVGCSALFATSYQKTQSEADGTATVEDTSWVPTGYTAWNSKVAYKVSDANSYSCKSGNRCWQIEVVSKDGCGSLYAEMALSDEAGTNVGYTNDTTSSLQPQQKALMQFTTYEDNATQGRIAKVSCY